MLYPFSAAPAQHQQVGRRLLINVCTTGCRKLPAFSRHGWTPGIHFLGLLLQITANWVAYNNKHGSLAVLGARSPRWSCQQGHGLSGGSRAESSVPLPPSGAPGGSCVTPSLPLSAHGRYSESLSSLLSQTKQLSFEVEPTLVIQDDVI